MASISENIVTMTFIFCIFVSTIKKLRTASKYYRKSGGKSYRLQICPLNSQDTDGDGVGG
jgi:hypothetical protein